MQHMLFGFHSFFQVDHWWEGVEHTELTASLQSCGSRLRWRWKHHRRPFDTGCNAVQVFPMSSAWMSSEKSGRLSRHSAQPRCHWICLSPPNCVLAVLPSGYINNRQQILQGEGFIKSLCRGQKNLSSSQAECHYSLTRRNSRVLVVVLSDTSNWPS